VPSHHLVNSTFAGLYASVFRGAGINFEEVREYREGDDIRHMDWKVTARINEPHLKVFREERERSVVLCIDRGPHMVFGTRGTFKSVQAARAAALIGWAASRLNDRVGGMAFGDPMAGLQHFRPARGRRALWQLLRTLTEPASEQSASIDCLGGRPAPRHAGAAHRLAGVPDRRPEPRRARPGRRARHPGPAQLRGAAAGGRPGGLGDPGHGQRHLHRHRRHPDRDRHRRHRRPAPTARPGSGAARP
jgi:uncharacterized protein (DUF58 family)